MKELRIHGRGGQGSVTAAELIATAAFAGGSYAQAFPAFGVERRGAPVQAFVRFSNEKIRLRSQIYEPDYIIVQDSTLIHSVNVFSGMSGEGIAIINTERKKNYDLPAGAKLIVIDATQIALEEIGLPITNTALMGAFAAASEEITLEALKGAIEERFPGKLAETNFAAAKRAYSMVAEGAV
ncbi:MAG: pyruvate ferredoxin oxidoreductase subunit gamma [Methanocalculaceae archaeon]|jgi:pyruvate ferredoxin oxidoreductase gamma subunit|nr:pyruvate ferredoxin oxidoreductase subunit gamma [Methanocalculaceae archaeon]